MRAVIEKLSISVHVLFLVDAISPPYIVVELLYFFRRQPSSFRRTTTEMDHSDPAPARIICDTTRW
jgi:hypothetical protein